MTETICILSLPVEIGTHLFQYLTDPKDQKNASEVCGKFLAWDRKAHSIDEKFATAQPELAKITAQFEKNFGQLYFESHRIARNKSGKWKWKYLPPAQIFLWISLVATTFTGLIFLLDDHLFPSITIWQTPLTDRQILLAKGALVTSSIGLHIYLLMKLRLNLQDPYLKHEYHQITTESFIKTYKNKPAYIMRKILWFNFEEFSKNPLYLKKLAYFDRIEPRTYGAIRVLVTLIESWMEKTTVNDPNEGTTIHQLFNAKDSASWKCFHNKLSEKNKKIHSDIINLYKLFLEKDCHNTYFTPSTHFDLAVNISLPPPAPIYI